MMTCLAVVLSCLPLDAPLCAIPPQRGEYRVVLLRVIDGDTVEVGLIVPVTLRLAGVDAPELRTPAGRQARDWLARHLEGGSLSIQLEGRDKYGRCLGDLVRDGQSVRRALLEAGHARPYP